MLNKCKLTIGLVTYNGEKTLSRSLESLRRQNFNEFNLVISDNNSTDLTQNICESFSKKFKNFKYIRRKKNFGPINNFWFVMEQAKTEYFMWASDDDLWDKKFVQNLYNELENNIDLDLVYCWTDVFDPELNIVHKKFKPANLYNRSKEYRYLKEIFNPCVNKYYGIFRLKSLKKFDYKKYKLYDYQDTILIDFFNLNFKIKIVEEKLFNYAENINKKRKSLDPLFQSNKYVRFNHFRYLFLTSKLLFISNFNFFYKIFYFLLLIFVFFGKKIINIFR